ncbi:MAG: hypothetical protein ACLF0G_01040 [Candidatus Brocadiia bacterium]
MSSEPASTFRDAARRAVRRCVLARWMRALGATSVPLFIAASALVLAARLGGLSAGHCEAWVALVAAWVAGTAVWAWVGRPAPTAALALWDQASGRHEMFVSAYCFESQPAPDPGETLHLAKARARMPQALRNIKRRLPAPLPHRAWALPVACTVLVVSGLLRPVASREGQAVDQEARRRARREASALVERSGVLDPLAGLGEEEKEAIDELKASLEETARKLEQLDDETPRQVLEELERRARDAEKLAESLGAGEEELLSAEMIGELERHADTAELAGRIRAKALEGIASEADGIARRLRSENLTLEEQKRVQGALASAMDVATREDKRRVIGRHVGGALRQLRAGRRGQAGRHFSRIAQHFRRAAQRRRAARRLQQLARRLRSSGQRIFGCRSGIRRLGPSSYGTLRGLGSQPAVSPRSLPLPRWALGRPPSQCPPGSQPYVQGRSPVPGKPGSCSGGSSPATPVPGGTCAGGTMGARSGGLYAGRGTAPYGTHRTTPQSPTSTGVVAPQVGSEGESETRRVEGTDHSEEARQKARELHTQFIRAEEEALDAEPLPLSRRREVLRYFTELRRRIEDDSP